MTNNNFRNFLLGTLAIVSTTVQSQYNKKLTDMQIEGLFGHKKAEQLVANQNNSIKYFYRMDKNTFLRQLDSLVMHAPKEEAFYYLPDLEVALEAGFDETPTSVRMDTELLHKLAKSYKIVESFHTHNACEDDSKMQKIPSHNDLKSLIYQYIITSHNNEKNILIGNHVSAHGLTSYTIYNRDYIKQGYNYLKKKDFNSLEIFSRFLANSAQDFISSKLTHYDLKIVELENTYTNFNQSTNKNDSIKYVGIGVPVDMDTRFGVKSEFLYIEHQTITPRSDLKSKSIRKLHRKK